MLYYEYPAETFVVDKAGQRIEPVKMKFLISSQRERIKPVGR
jgi:hypothetical protein